MSYAKLGKPYNNHIATHSINVINKQGLSCKFCEKPYMSEAWLLKHELLCPRRSSVSKQVSDLNITNPFLNIDVIAPSVKEEIRSRLKRVKLAKKNTTAQLDELQRFCLKDKLSFSILHLNINGINTAESKYMDIQNILNLRSFDIILLSETKLEDSTTNHRFSNSNYKLYRRDRNQYGGGLMFYLRREYQIIESFNSPDFEMMHMKINVNGVICDFILSYKPPNESNEEFLEYQHSFIMNLDNSNPIFLIGDLNMDLLTTKGDVLRQFMVDVNMKNYVTSPTRECKYNMKESGTIKETSTLLDVIIHNNNVVKSTNVLPCPFSDHKFIMANLSLNRKKNANQEIFSRGLTETKVLEIVEAVNNQSFEYLNETPNCTTQWDNLKSHLVELMDSIAPLKRVEIRQSTLKKRFPWIDAELIKSKSIRDSAYRVKDNLTNGWNLYKTARQEYSKLSRIKIKEFFSSRLMSSFDSSKSFWKFYKNEVKTKSSSSEHVGIESLNVDSQHIQQPEKIAEVFNNFFTTIESNSSTTKQESIRLINKNFQTLKGNGTIKPGSFSFENVVDNDVLEALNSIDSDTSPGISNIPIKIFKLASAKLVPVLRGIINNCISSSTIPSEWKWAVVTPLYKSKGSKHDMNNYRGISILPAVSKFFEKLVYKQMNAYFETNSLIFDGQHGFRRGYSCETAIHEILNSVNKNLDKKLVNLLLFIDLRKAFDTVDIDLLIVKLMHYGFDNMALNLIKDYFTDRRQKIKIGLMFSALLIILLGVPQGSILGPLLFLIFINDLPYYLELVLSKLFADDTTLCIAGHDILNAISRLKDATIQLLEWCCFNRMDINWSKTYVMFIGTNKDAPSSVFINENVSISVVTQFKLLGVTIDDKLSFVSHVSQICSKINSKLHCLKRLYYMPNDVKLLFFKSIVMPHFDYCSSISIYYSKTALQKLSNCYYVSLYKLLKINLVNMSVSTINQHLAQYQLMSFTHRLFFRLTTFSFKFISNSTCPPLLKNELKSNEERALPWVLRNHDHIQHPKIKKAVGEKSFSFFFSKFINRFCIPHKELTIQQFRSHILKSCNVSCEIFIGLFDNFNLKTLSSNFDLYRHKSKKQKKQKL